jgi:GntR family transcriptional repressor for pyruvate dehydrogenase complex
MEKACSNYIKNADTESKVSDDFAFHRAIAEGAHNPVLKAMLLVVITDILAVYEKEQNIATKKIAGEHHKQILSALKNRDADLAESLMVKHLNGVMEFAKDRIGQIQNQY